MTMKLDGKRWVSMPVAALLSLLTAAVSGALAYGTMQSDQRAAKATLDDHTVRIQRIETRMEDLREIKNDISWIKQTMQQDRVRRSSP